MQQSALHVALAKMCTTPFQKEQQAEGAESPWLRHPAQEARGGQEAGGRTGAGSGFRGTEQPSPRVGPWESALHYPAAQRQRETRKGCLDLLPRPCAQGLSETLVPVSECPWRVSPSAARRHEDAIAHLRPRLSPRWKLGPALLRRKMNPARAGGLPSHTCAMRCKCVMKTRPISQTRKAKAWKGYGSFTRSLRGFAKAGAVPRARGSAGALL